MAESRGQRDTAKVHGEWVVVTGRSKELGQFLQSITVALFTEVISSRVN